MPTRGQGPQENVRWTRKSPAKRAPAGYFFRLSCDQEGNPRFDAKPLMAVRWI